MIATRGRKGNEIDMVRTVSFVFTIKKPEMLSFLYSCILCLLSFSSFLFVSLLHYNTYYQRAINALRSKNSEKWRTQFHSFNWTPALRSLQSLWGRGNLTLDSSAKLSPPPLRSLSRSFSSSLFSTWLWWRKQIYVADWVKSVLKSFPGKIFSVEIGFRPFVYLFVATHDGEFYFNEKY